MTCAVDSCERPVRAGGYCNAHYQRVQKTGNPQVEKPITVRDVHEVVTAGGAHLRIRSCWGSASNYACIECGDPAKDWAYDGTDPSELYEKKFLTSGSKVFYSLYPEFYMPMCRSCHNGRDRAQSFTELAEYRTLKHETGLSYEEIRAIVDRELKVRKNYA